MRRQLAAATLATAAALTTIAALPGPADAATPTSHRHFVRMTGRQEVPGPGDRNGFGSFVYRVRGWTLCYVITAHNIKPAMAAHIHWGKKGVAGPIVVTLKAPTKGVARGCITAVRHQNDKNAATTLTKHELRGIVKWPRWYYVNAHNAKFPNGAIRGQLG